MAAIAAQSYTPTEEAEIQQWLTTSERLRAPSAEGTSSIIEALNTHLASRTTLLGAKPSKADVAIYEALAPAVRKWSPQERTGEAGHPHIVRHLDFVQNSPLFGLEVPEADKIKVDPEEILYVKPPVDAKAEKERLKKEKAAAAAAAAAGGPAGAAGANGGEKKTVVDRTKEAAGKAKEAVKEKAGAAAGAAEGKKKEKKEKTPRPQKPAPAPPAPLSPALIDLRVGHILKAIKHPEADSLYVSTIAMGDPAGTPDTEEYEGQIVRTVCSGLNGLVPLEEMQGRKVVVVCNLKPVKMRGIKSSAMVLAASPRLKEGEVDEHKGPVELVNPPADAKAGERVFFEGWKGEPEKQLNPKKKIWETFQPGFTTTESLEVGFDAGVVKDLGKEGLGKLVTESGGVCTVKTLKGATVR
ncbi:tRNA-aminoacylation cofactor ARC1 [Pleurostoma richardsiae]|uniref:tRNA-aminoacylation cofactor ARC1 n=1 Tax=Pleurostoma richardsiae TaxID=41990 RepID=A0AA38RQG3_9PEZI|nr:tRNA-aminoacylation cofactor ARC1 [Pleurostoma richardsiae]